MVCHLQPSIMIRLLCVLNLITKAERWDGKKDDRNQKLLGEKNQ